MLTKAGVPAVVAAVLLMAGPAWAQRGGGHGGGFHSGGFHSGGFRSGGFHSGGFPSGGFHLGGFRSGGFRSGGFHNGGFHRGGFHSNRFHHRGFYPGYYYGFYPSYSYYPSYGDYQPYSYDPSYDLGYDSDSGPAYYDSYSGAAPSYSSGYQAVEPYSTVSPDAAPAQTDSTVHVTVKVPTNAKVWFDGSKTRSTGSVREYQSPSLRPGRYTYVIRARWTENGRAITQTQTVAFSPGAHLKVNFPMASGTN
jgi:uncharacterized protein (TIGR03000 family)